ncbi:MAG: hypothetical protein ACRDTF_10560 [Pseudonocardiaceae bacterium]
MASGFERASAQLVGIKGQQNDLQAAVAAGELWMEAGVAETAARRCEQAVTEIDEWLGRARQLIQTRKLGDNPDGNGAAARFSEAGWDFVDSMKGAQLVFTNMAATYRAAGRTVTQADEAGQETFRGRSG